MWYVRDDIIAIGVSLHKSIISLMYMYIHVLSTQRWGEDIHEFQGSITVAYFGILHSTKILILVLFDAEKNRSVWDLDICFNNRIAMSAASKLNLDPLVACSLTSLTNQSLGFIRKQKRE